MILRIPVKWRGRMLKKGSKISASIGERARLLRLGWAVDHVEPKPNEAKRTYKRRDVAKAPERAVVAPEPPHVLPPTDEEGYKFTWPSQTATPTADADDGQE